MRDRRAKKGFLGTVRRACNLPVRYGLTPVKVLKQLQLMVDTARRADCLPTIGVTAANLDRHPTISSGLAGLDLVVHGYQHVGYGSLSDEEQARDLDLARNAFSAVGLRASGFRAPYLDTNSSTLRLLRDRGFAFDSSLPHVALPAESESRSAVLKHALSRYGPVEMNLQNPYMESDLVELPVGLPDDELLIDAMGLRNPELILRVLTSMLTHTANENSLLVLQIHPERFSLFAAAIREILSKTSDMGGWKTNLTELAAWIRIHHGFSQRWPHGQTFALALTGDLDALTLTDFGGRLWPKIA